MNLFSLSRKQAGSSFSSVTAHPANLVDILSLDRDDFRYISKGKYNTVFLTNNQGRRQIFYNDKPLRYLALSPSQTQVSFFYAPNNQSSEELTLILLEKENGAFREIFQTRFASWDVRSDLHWLGDNHLFFLRHCGTACQGITLLTVATGKTKNATLSYSSFSDQPATTHFKDWFGQEFELPGLVDEVYSETKNGYNYLVIKIKDDKGLYLGENRFLFTGSGLLNSRSS